MITDGTECFYAVSVASAVIRDIRVPDRAWVLSRLTPRDPPGGAGGVRLVTRRRPPEFANSLNLPVHTASLTKTARPEMRV